MRIFLLVLALGGILTGVCLAGPLSVGVRTEVYDPPGDQGPTFMIGVTADWRFHAYASVEGNLEWTQYKTGGVSVTEMPITVNGIGHFLGASRLDPYAGAGVGYYMRSVGGVSDGTFGIQALAGVKYAVSNRFDLGAEIKYSIPDVSNFDVHGLTWGLQATGGFDIGK